MFDSWEARIRLTGMFLELLGLATVAWGLRETRKRFGEPGLLQLAMGWLNEFPAFHRHVQLMAGSGEFKIGGTSATLFVGTVSATTSLEERVSLLEKKVDQINSAIQKKIDEEAEKQKRAVEAERVSRETGDKSNRDLLKEAMAGGLHLETMGVLWLFFGLALSTASAEIARLLTGS